MRGAQSDGRHRQVRPGIIPADAGSTYYAFNPEDFGGDHPRRCGEHLTVPSPHRSARGSSPQMRGARSNALTQMVSIRIIPADAGSTCCRKLIFNTHEDHPRRCGEHLLASQISHSWSGSSPQMRGALDGIPDGFLPVGIIPADAGSTLRNPFNPNNIIDKISNF